MSKLKPLTERQQALLDALFGSCEGDVRAAMDEAGYSPKTSVEEALKPIREHLIEASSNYLAANAPMAVTKLVGVLRNPEALGNKNTIAAAASILDRTGLVKTERVEVEATNPGVFLIPPKDPQ